MNEYIPTYYGPSFDRWIPVDERLPEKEGRYLVFHGFVLIANWVDGSWIEYSDQYTDYVSGITHWRPLPEHPA